MSFPVTKPNIIARFWKKKPNNVDKNNTQSKWYLPDVPASMSPDKLPGSKYAIDTRRPGPKYFKRSFNLNFIFSFSFT
jgi:hypothetical protein